METLLAVADRLAATIAPRVAGAADLAAGTEVTGWLLGDG